MNIVYRLLCIVIGYIFGLFQTAFIYGKLHGIDIRDYGSGNAGTTNALRVLGKKAGLITYIGDCLKAVVAGFIIRFIFKSQPDLEFVYVLYTGLGVVLGHNFPFFMGFKGGKGVAATSGVVIALLDIRVTLIGFVIFVAICALTRYVSLASILSVCSVPTSVIIFSNTGTVKGLTNDYKLESYILLIIFALFVIFRHRENIKRLLSGTERKLGVHEGEVQNG